MGSFKSNMVIFCVILYACGCITEDLSFILIPWITTPQNFTGEQLNLYKQPNLKV